MSDEDAIFRGDLDREINHVRGNVAQMVEAVQREVGARDKKLRDDLAAAGVGLCRDAIKGGISQFEATRRAMEGAHRRAAQHYRQLEKTTAERFSERLSYAVGIAGSGALLWRYLHPIITSVFGAIGVKI